MTTSRPRDIAPVRLHDSSSGRWLRIWSNGVDLFIRDEETGRSRQNPQWLSANVHRTRDARGEDTKHWTVRLFVGGHRESVAMDTGVRSLREARQLLAYLAASWNPTDGSSQWWLREHAQPSLRKAALEAFDREQDRRYGLNQEAYS